MTDQIDPELGKPIYFNVEKFVETVDMFIASDEGAIALEMIYKLPAYYKDHPHPLIEAKKKHLLSSVSTLIDYQTSRTEGYQESLDHENRIHPDWNLTDLGNFMQSPFCYPRAQIITQVVSKFNEEGVSPHIVELGPANYWVPHGLKKLGKTFTYEPITLNHGALLSHLPKLDGLLSFNATKRPTIFICFEVIEHMWNPREILNYYHRANITAEKIIISTPLYSLLGGRDPKEVREIEHIRTFGPKQLFELANDLFPGYDWVNHVSALQVIEGTKTVPA